MANAKKAQSDRLITPEGRCSYAHVFRPRKNDAGEEQYSLVLIIPKTSVEAIKVLKDAAKKVAAEEYGADFPDKVRAGKLRWPFRDGDTEKEGDPVYANSIFMTMRNTNKPEIIDRNQQPIDSPELFGSGDYCRVSGRFFAYDTKGNKGISFSLGNIQKTKTGQRLDNRVAAKTEFDALGGADPGDSAGTPTGYDDL